MEFYRLLSPYCGFLLYLHSKNHKKDEDLSEEILDELTEQAKESFYRNVWMIL